MTWFTVVCCTMLAMFGLACMLVAWAILRLWAGAIPALIAFWILGLATIKGVLLLALEISP